jgi:hypothetical protein
MVPTIVSESLQIDLGTVSWLQVCCNATMLHEHKWLDFIDLASATQTLMHKPVNLKCKNKFHLSLDQWNGGSFCHKDVTQRLQNSKKLFDPYFTQNLFKISYVHDIHNFCVSKYTWSKRIWRIRDGSWSVVTSQHLPFFHLYVAVLLGKKTVTLFSSLYVWKVFFVTSYQRGRVGFKNGSVHGPAFQF